jgi:FtsZ-binding cell division protein ZapB
MHWDSLEELELKINKVLELVDKLKEENRQVTNSYNKLSSNVFEIEGKNKVLAQENNQLKAQIKEREESIRNKEEKIKRRIENILARLDNIE